jgi:general secretion pathway protein I
MRNSGFTLVEVLVAFVILGLSLASAYAAFSGGLRAELRAEQSARGVLLAQSYLSEIGVSRPLVEGAEEEVLETGETVRVEMREIDVLALARRPRVSAWEVGVEITTPDGGTVRLAELKLGPP